MERRLAAILVADLVGYSRLMGNDERGTLERFNALRRDLLGPLIESHGGRVVKSLGDGLLVEFPSAVNALTCAVEWQAAVAKDQAETTEDRRFNFRIGLNLGDIIAEDGDIHDDGVNLAARIEAQADPGGICVSPEINTQSKGKVPIAFEDLGERRLKNVAEPVRLFRVLGSAVASGGASSPLPLPEKPSIAVLPFDNMSADPEQAYFSDGVTEDIITELSRFPTLFVIGRNSTFSYKGRATDLRQIGRELGVQYILEGSIRRAGNRVRITAQLIDSASGAHVWAERYDRDLEDIFVLQEEITSNVAGAIAPQIEMAEMDRVHSGWAVVERFFVIDSRDPRAHMCRGLIHHLRSEFDEAVADFRRAFDLNRNFALNLFTLAWCESLAGYPSEAREHAALGLRLSPRDDDLWLGVAYLALAQAAFADRDFAETRKWAAQAIQMHPRAPIRRALMIACDVHDGDLSGAEKHAEFLNSFAPDLIPSVLRGYVSFYKLPEHNALLADGLRNVRKPG